MEKSLRGGTTEIARLEELAAGNTILHRLHPGAKLLGTLLYLLGLLSLGPDQFGRLGPFLLYPLIATVLGEVPRRVLMRRILAALPFCLLAGLGSLFFDRSLRYTLGAIPVTGGMLTCGSILLRGVLLVWAVSVLMAVTPADALFSQLRRMHVPGVLVRLLEMTYRYIGTLLEEVERMQTAYALRSGGQPALEMRHMGAFVGMLLLKSHGRAQRVHSAMLLRGYGAEEAGETRRPFARNDYVYLLLCLGSTLCFRLVDIPALLGRWLLCWM